MNDRFTVFGNLSIDDLVFADGTTRWAVPGGNAMYSALGMTVWTDRVSVVAPVGDDYPLGDLAEHIDLSRCPKVPRTLRSWGLYEEDGSRHFIFRNATRNWLDFSPRPEVVRSGHQKAAHVAPMPWAIAMGMIAELRAVGTEIVVVDLDDRELREIGVERSAQLLRSADLFLPSRQDVHALFPEASPVEALKRLRDLAPDVAVIAVKCGSEGIVAHAAGAREWFQIPSIPVDVIDATGAGDSFCGGSTVGFTETRDALEGLLRGAVSASFCIGGVGLSGLQAAGKDEAELRLKRLRDRVTFHAF